MAKLTREAAIEIIWNQVELQQDSFMYGNTSYPNWLDLIDAVCDLGYVDSDAASYTMLPVGGEDPDGIRSYRAALFCLHLFILAAEGEL